jgi:hypothetical protein
VTALINELAAAQAADDEVVLVIDDCHLTDSRLVLMRCCSWLRICRQGCGWC